MKGLLTAMGLLMACGAPSRASAQNRHASAPVTSTWYLQPEANQGFFGPVTYDRLAVFDGSGLPRRDPQIRSTVAAVRMERILPLGAYYVRGFWRYFEPVENTELAANASQHSRIRRNTSVRSEGGGAEIGWNFAIDRLSDGFRPCLGLAVEQNRVAVQIEQQEAGAESSGRLVSEVLGLYVRLVAGYRFGAWPADLEVLPEVSIPIRSQQTLMQAKDADADLENRLQHGMRGGAAIGFGLGWKL